MSSYTEKPVYTHVNIALSRIAILFMIFLICYEISFVIEGNSPIMLIYTLIFPVLWVWKCGFDYTYTINDHGITIERTGFGFKKSWFYASDEIEGVVVYFKRKLFQKDSVGRYVSRFSTLDANNAHLLVVKKDGKKMGVIIKCTDRFFKRIKKNHPEIVHEML